MCVYIYIYILLNSGQSLFLIMFCLLDLLVSEKDMLKFTKYLRVFALHISK